MLESIDESLEEIGEVPVVFESLPRLEIGVAAAALQVPAYPSSSVVSDRQFIVPWFIYRSDKVQVKDGGVELIAYQSDRLIIDLGIGGSLNADTSETPLREGMPDIDFLFEVGPRFNVPFLDSTKNNIRSRLNWFTSLRFAVSTDFRRLDFRGPLLNTEVEYRLEGFSNNKLSFNTSVFANWLGDDLMDYFFAVDDEFVTATRPAFDANAGFLNAGVSLGVSYRPTPALTTFLGLGYTSYKGSENDDSPLFEDDINTSIILAASWRFFESERRVTVRDE